jgi:hypothetical protein
MFVNDNRGGKNFGGGSGGVKHNINHDYSLENSKSHELVEKFLREKKWLDNFVTFKGVIKDNDLNVDLNREIVDFSIWSFKMVDKKMAASKAAIPCIGKEWDKLKIEISNSNTYF